MRTTLFAILLALCATSDACHAQGKCPSTSSLGVGSVTQGGYTFEYESLKGTNCLVYRVRNTPKKLLTPVSWKGAKETLIETSLGECATQASCIWFTSSLITTALVAPAPTKLSFGPNRDDYTTTPDALLPKRQDKNARESALHGFTTILEGVIAEGTKLRRTTVGVSVSSEVKDLGPDKGFSLVYVVKLIDNSEPMRMLASAAENGPDDLAMVWESAGVAFANQLRQLKLNTQTTKDKPVQIGISATGLQVESSKLLAIYRGKTRIAATSAPAYLRPE